MRKVRTSLERKVRISLVQRMDVGRVAAGAIGVSVSRFLTNSTIAVATFCYANQPMLNVKRGCMPIETHTKYSIFPRWQERIVTASVSVHALVYSGYGSAFSSYKHSIMSWLHSAAKEVFKMGFWDQHYWWTRLG